MPIEELPTKRDMVYEFMSLNFTLKSECARACDLVEPEDSLMEGADLFIKWFQRAEQRNLLTVFWDRIKAAKNKTPHKIKEVG